MKFLEVYGVKIIVDPTCRIGTWSFESEQMRRLRKLILDLSTFMKCHMLNLESIEITERPAPPKEYQETLSPFPCGCRTCVAHSKPKPDVLGELCEHEAYIQNCLPCQSAKFHSQHPQHKSEDEVEMKIVEITQKIKSWSDSYLSNHLRDLVRLARGEK